MARTGQQLRQRTAKAMAQPHGTTGPAPARGANAPRSGWGDRLRYGFDNSMSRGTPALIVWLCIVTAALIVVFSVITTVFRLRSEAGDAGFLKERSEEHTAELPSLKRISSAGFCLEQNK